MSDIEAKIQEAKGALSEMSAELAEVKKALDAIPCGTCGMFIRFGVVRAPDGAASVDDTVFGLRATGATFVEAYRNLRVAVLREYANRIERGDEP